jgi:hypothetical protein
MAKIRINNIGFIPKGSDYGSFVKYYKNKKYNKLEKYLNEGWEDKGSFIKQENITIDKNCFSSEEFNCTIAELEYISSECCTELRTIGSRVLDLSLQDREDFFEVYRMIDSRMYKENETEN